MSILKLSTAAVAEPLDASFRRGHNGDASSKSQRKPVGVVTSQLTQLQARCLIAACAFWAVASAFALPSLLVFGLLLIPMWVTAEMAFLVWWCILYQRLNAQPVPHRPPPHVNPREVFDRFIRDQSSMCRYIDILQMISTWHWNVPISELSRENVADLLCYGFYYRSREQMADEGMGHVPEQLVSELEVAWGVKFAPGVGQEGGEGKPYVRRRIMTHLWEPVRCFYRPLAFYAGVEVLIALKHVMLLAAGFRAHMYQGMLYYTYGLPATAAAAAVQQQGHSLIRSETPTVRTAASDVKAPILFLHGVGLGLLPYLNFLLRLSSLERPVVAVEVRHLSMRVCVNVPEEDEVVACIAGALARHSVKQVHVVAHSYGTFMASRLVQLHRPMVASLTLLDPVCFIMFSGKLIYNFVYRNPLEGASSLTWFIARDLAHAVSVSRRFYWSLLNLWPDQLPQHTLVALSAQDELVPVPEVLTMLKERPEVRVRVHDGHRHADFIKDLPEQARMVQMVAELVDAATNTASPDTATAVLRWCAGDLPPSSSAGTDTGRSRDSASSYEAGSVLSGPGRGCQDWKKSAA
ncbi:hypothetical protein VOLCADRAFT_115694 [Volvox carteri f. nagariensis]|uniref:AB hydrolase-1 domain-containing protein n=1 Tax=Volvox carteri f. nagariensis TaxID=3068 RepID=D8THR7_VOLCA|nr:uncharacterized protein VOLCADRAFT_115694 [Volvox carteri f. nagariensis]EFJ53114.1 hypothetical protein VOLCADRAFT_115694 [Volvox carteri f. nagariensis]|eukprot:XP_002946119.1 hypothetical protein VOLCADRAFT_115694 [Volvox carteri f. nagariensis]